MRETEQGLGPIDVLFANAGGEDQGVDPAQGGGQARDLARDAQAEQADRLGGEHPYEVLIGHGLTERLRDVLGEGVQRVAVELDVMSTEQRTIVWVDDAAGAGTELLGGKLGSRYHRKVDRAGYEPV